MCSYCMMELGFLSWLDVHMYNHLRFMSFVTCDVTTDAKDIIVTSYAIGLFM